MENNNFWYLNIMYIGWFSTQKTPRRRRYKGTGSPAFRSINLRNPVTQLPTAGSFTRGNGHIKMAMFG